MKWLLELLERKFIKKEEIISDGGIRQKGNYVDFIVILVCIIVVCFLIYLGVNAYKLYFNL